MKKVIKSVIALAMAAVMVMALSSLLRLGKG